MWNRFFWFFFSQISVLPIFSVWPMPKIEKRQTTTRKKNMNWNDNVIFHDMVIYMRQCEYAKRLRTLLVHRTMKRGVWVWVTDFHSMAFLRHAFLLWRIEKRRRREKKNGGTNAKTLNVVAYEFMNVSTSSVSSCARNSAQCAHTVQSRKHTHTHTHTYIGQLKTHIPDSHWHTHTHTMPFKKTENSCF